MKISVRGSQSTPTRTESEAVTEERRLRNCVQSRKKGRVMKRFTATLSTAVLVGSLAGSALAAGQVQARNEDNEQECHLKFPAIRQRTLSSDSPQLKSATTGDVIDFYGSCDESPTGADQIRQQKHDEEFQFARDYEGGE
jgi:preprotein translocase subunit SecG